MWVFDILIHMKMIDDTLFDQIIVKFLFSGRENLFVLILVRIVINERFSCHPGFVVLI